MDDPFTMELRLCDNAGFVSDERVEDGSPGTVLDPDLTYRKLLNNLRAHNSNPDARAPWEGDPFPCTGSAHAAGEHIRCTSPAHKRPEVYGIVSMADQTAVLSPATVTKWRNGYCHVCGDALLTTHLGPFCNRCQEGRSPEDAERA